MQRLALHYNKQMIQGEFSLKELNFLFVFQVNCPGCFLYGIPMVESLYKKYANKVSFLGISTAFEDYEFNNHENTKKLLNDGELVGVTKQYLNKPKYEVPISFPIAMDAKADEEFDYIEAAGHICNLNPDYSNWTTVEKNALQKRVINYLKSQEDISLTFTLNQLAGTPSFIIVNDKLEVLSYHFGHQDETQLENELKSLLSYAENPSV